MFKKPKENLTPEKEIFFELLRRYENSLHSLGLNEEEILEEIGEFIQLSKIFK